MKAGRDAKSLTACFDSGPQHHQGLIAQAIVIQFERN
jgi:hypothetical protein